MHISNSCEPLKLAGTDTETSEIVLLEPIQTIHKIDVLQTKA